MARFVEGKFIIAFDRDDVRRYIEYSENFEISFVDFLKMGLEVPRHQRVEVKGTDVNLEDLDLSNLDLSGIHLINPKTNAQTKFDGTLLFDTTFSGTVNLKETDIQKAVKNMKTSIPEEAISPAQKKSIAKRMSVLYASANSSDSPEFKRILAKKGKTYKEALKAALDFTRRDHDDLGIDDYIFIVRLELKKAQNSENAEGIRSASQKLAEINTQSLQVIETMIRQTVDQQQTTVRKILGVFRSPDERQKEIKEFIVQSFLEGFKNSNYLRDHFLPETDKESLQGYFDSTIPKFVNDINKHISPDLLKTTPQKPINEVLTEFNRSQIFQYHKERISAWQDLQLQQSNRESVLKRIAQLDVKPDDSGVATRAGQAVSRAASNAAHKAAGMIGQTHNLERASAAVAYPTQPSSYPAIDPTDINAIKRDLALKRRAVRLLMDAGVGVAALVTFNPILGGLGLVGNIVTDKVILDRFFVPENHHKFDNQLGDKLLEIGLIAETLCPNGKYLAVSIGSALLSRALDAVVPIGPLQGLVRTHAGINTSLALWALSKDVPAIYGAIQHEKQKADPLKRIRPGTRQFELKVQPKLLNLKMFYIATTLTLASLIVAVFAITLITPIAAPMVAVLGGFSMPVIVAGGVAAFGAISSSIYFGGKKVLNITGYLTEYFERKKSQNEADIEGVPLVFQGIPKTPVRTAERATGRNTRMEASAATQTRHIDSNGQESTRGRHAQMEIERGRRTTTRRAPPQ